MQPSFMVREVEASFPRIHRLSLIDTVIIATSWAIVPPVIPPVTSVQDPSANDPGPSTQELNVPIARPSAMKRKVPKSLCEVCKHGVVPFALVLGTSGSLINPCPRNYGFHFMMLPPSK